MVRDSPQIQLSIVIPCLNEADTLAICIRKAWQGAKAAGVHAEIIVADNGSTDASPQIAQSLGARVINVAERGYGSALMGGISAARGQWILMGDADDSYDFEEIPTFVAKLRDGFSLVQGCRLPGGGGRVMPGAMPFLHRWLGNPLFSWMVRRMFYAPIHDVYCGMRAFTKDMYLRLDQRCTGMEFATEMILKASLAGESIAEVPITLHPDARTTHAPHLKTFRDGWRTLRFFMLSSPKWLFWAPGVLLIFAGLAGFALALPGTTIAGATFDAHTLLFSAMFLIMGTQAVAFSLFAKILAVKSGMLPPDPRLDRAFVVLRLEHGIILSCLAMAGGMGILLAVTWQWISSDFGGLDYARTMRLVIPGVTLASIGFEGFLWSWFITILGMPSR